MHRALLYRIVSEILQHNRTDLHVSDPGFVPDQSLSSHKVLLARDSLAALTTTCRIFCEPAMDTLWATVVLCELPPLERSECVEIIYLQH